MEPPGTAPGSEPLITRAIYHHSLQADPLNVAWIDENTMDTLGEKMPFSV